MLKRIVHSALVTAIAGIIFLSITHAATAAPSKVSMMLGQTGVVSLKQDGRELISNGDFFVSKVAFQRGSGPANIEDAGPGQVQVDSAHQNITRIFPWGQVTCNYVLQGSELNLTVSIKNSSSDTLSGIAMQLMEINFPQMPKGWVPDRPALATNIGDPPVLYASYGMGTMAVCDDDVSGKPLIIGFPGRHSFVRRTIMLQSANMGLMDFRWDPLITRPIEPNGSDVYHISIRLGTGNASEPELAYDIFQKFGALYPFKLNWRDRRPIAMLHVSTSEHHPVNNPRGWFLSDPSIDVTTPAGRAALKDRLLKYADTSIPILKDMHAQGMIAWDLEGQEYPHATSYIGDPTIISQVAPEMDPIVNEFMKKYTDAGLRIGVCVRPQRLQFGAKVEQVEVNDPAANLIRKIAYAKKRWGCTLFYVDSDGDPNVPYDVSVFIKVTQAFPDCLIIPENQNTAYYSVSAPYETLVGGVVTPPEVHYLYPYAFEVLFVTDGDQDKRHGEVVYAAKHGEILMFHGWWNNPNNLKTKVILREAGVY